MSWKIEKWLADVFPGETNIYTEYSTLNDRELVIVACASLDLAIAELLSLRFVFLPKEYEDFLGLSGDGRAPAGSFGSRIQLSLLLGIITERDASILRAFKNLWNVFAHKVNVSLHQGESLKYLFILLDNFQSLGKEISKNNQEIYYSEDNFNEIRYYLDKLPDAGGGLILSIFCIYQAYFHRLHERVARIKERCWE